MEEEASIFLEFHESNKLTTIECETGLLIIDQLQKLLIDAQWKHFSDAGLQYTKGFIAQIVLSMIPMAGRNWNLRGYDLVLNMRREGTVLRLGSARIDLSKETTHEFIVTVHEQPIPRWHNYVPGFLKFMIKRPVVLSPIYEIKKRAVTKF